MTDAPYHAHIYFSPEERATAEALRASFQAEPDVLFVGRMTEGKAGLIRSRNMRSTSTRALSTRFRT